MPTTNHPSDVALTAPDDSTRVHIAGCERCQRRLEAATDAVVPVPDGDGSMPAVYVPEALVTAMGDLPDFDDAPAPRQLWRLEFDGTAAPAVVVDVTEDTLVVWAVGEDIEFADAATVLLDDAMLGFEVGVWTSLEFAVPRVTAERRIGDVTPDVFDKLVDVRDRMRRGELPGGAGAAFTSDLDSRLAYRGELATPFHAFVQLASDLAHEDEQSPSLKSVLDDAGLKRDSLAELGFAPEDIRALAQDHLWLEDGEVAKIAMAAEQPAEYIAAHAPRPPLDLVAAMHKPRHRAQVAREAVTRAVPETVARRDATRGVWAQQRRTEGRGKPDWDAAIDSYFAGR